MIPEHPVFLGSEIDNAEPENALFHVLPAPLEKSVSYGTGTSRGPSALLKASWQLELWDGFSVPSDEGIHTCQPIDCNADAATVVARIAEAVASIIHNGAVPVVLGGEHTASYGAVEGLLKAGVSDFGVVQIDAHADLRDAYEGDRWSHASVMRRVVERDIPVHQLGVRALCSEEIEARRAHKVSFDDAHALVVENRHSIELPAEFPSKVYFSLDIDGMDPSVFPATGTPVPGGLGWYQTLALFESVARQRQIIGFDIMEFAPIPGFHAYDFAGALLCQKLMGILSRNRQAGPRD